MEQVRHDLRIVRVLGRIRSQSGRRIGNLSEALVHGRAALRLRFLPALAEELKHFVARNAAQPGSKRLPGLIAPKRSNASQSSCEDLLEDIVRIGPPNAVPVAPVINQWRV